ncbi:MAG TPA: tetratricopeptide repeat protein, partial [Phaeodactylibacter sp.]|nr:tetratricopeptide repeat protein [Phaeodactylibacter sp.]
MKKLLLLLFAASMCFAAQASQKDIDRLVKQMKTQQGIEKMSSLQALSTASLQLGNRLAAKDYAEQALELARKQNNQAQEAAAMDCMAMVYQDMNDYTNAMKSYVQALKIRDQLKDEAAIALSKNHIGRIFFLQEDVPNALENLNAALELCQKTNSKETAAEVNKNLGEVYLLKGFIGKAKEHYDRSMNLYIELGQINKAADLASYLGHIMKEVNDYEGALAYYRMSLDFNRSLERLPEIAADYNNISLTLAAQLSYDEALENNEMAYNLRKGLTNKTDLAESLKNFGMIYAAMGKKQLALDYLHQASTLLKEVGFEPGTQNIYKDIADSYRSIGDFEKAYENHVAYAKSRDIIYDKEKSRAILELTTKYESEFEAEKQKAEIAILQKEQAYSAKMRTFLMALLALGALLLFVVYISYTRKKKANLLLTAKNEEIQRQKAEIDKQNKMLEENLNRLDILNSKL